MNAVRPVHTYSIVARDPATGDLGAAVQSHWFNVGRIVLWAEAGVGAVATQSFAEPAYGPRGLAGMRAGGSAADVLAALIADDAVARTRQVAMVDAHGGTGAHTGDGCIAAAGHECGDGFSVQANMMRDESIWPAMAAAYRNSLDDPTADLAERLLHALAAGEAAGGDFRGQQSAAILVVPADATDTPWDDVRFDLRVEDHPDPVGELTRLVALQRAYDLMNHGDAKVAHNDWDGALAAYSSAAAAVPDIVELSFWHGVGLVHAGRTDEACAVFSDVFRREPFWREAVDRLVPAGQFPDDPALLARIRALPG